MIVSKKRGDDVVAVGKNAVVYTMPCTDPCTNPCMAQLACQKIHHFNPTQPRDTGTTLYCCYTFLAYILQGFREKL